jgi:succinate-semialdehyde dehydrogenase/glutarate-semialdehyde dehydrogenase
MVGNTILLKHASMVPQCGIAMEELFKEAQAPEGLYTNLLISGRRSTALVSDERIKVSLTGSEAAGSSMAEAAGKYLKNQYLN